MFCRSSVKSDTVLPALLLVEDLSQLLSIDAPSQHGDKSAGDHHMQVSNAPPGQSLCREARRTQAQAGQKCFCWLCWRCKTARWRWQSFKTPCMDGKCGNQTWRLTGSWTHLHFTNDLLLIEWTDSRGATATRLPTCQVRVQAGTHAQDCGDTVTDLQTTDQVQHKSDAPHLPTWIGGHFICVYSPSTAPHPDHWSTTETTWLAQCCRSKGCGGNARTNQTLTWTYVARAKKADMNRLQTRQMTRSHGCVLFPLRTSSTISPYPKVSPPRPATRDVEAL